MAIQYFSEQRLDDLRHHYCEDQLFRTFSPVLCELQEKRGELNPVILWHEVETLRERLKKANYPETEVAYLVEYLLKQLAQQTVENNKIINRPDERVIESMLCILLLLFFQLADATPSADKLDENPNHAICSALARILTDPQHSWYIEPMRNNLTIKKTDFLGNKIVLPVVDYMKAKVSLDAMDEIAKKNYERIIEHIRTISANLFPKLLHISQDKFMEIWKNICLDTDLFFLVGKREPRTYPYDFNFKLFCNVLGILQFTSLPSGKSALSTNVQEVNAAIGDKNNRNYITYYNQCDSYCAYSKDQFNQIKRIVANTLSEQPV